MQTSRLRFAALAAIFLAARMPADETASHVHEAISPENFGSVDFPVSCGPEARKRFERSVAILHSFGYELAEESFRATAQADASCAMAWWGVAMSRYHPIWYPPTPEDLKVGRDAVARARALPAPTAREGAYIGAIGSFYDESDTVDHKTRALRYEKAMESLSAKYPEDREGAAFYALSLLSTAPPTDKTYSNQKKAAVILERIFTENPKHPGAAHYIIHSFDSPALAPLALNAARSYAKIAPSAPHALHMPSHIFTRLGDWEDSIASNRASAASALSMAQKLPAGATPSQRLHAFDYLVYAYLQEARDKDARAVVDETAAIEDAEPRDLTGAFAFSAIPARYALERSRFDEAARLELHPASYPWKSFPFAEAIVVFARTVGQARQGHEAQARAELSRMEPISRNAAALSKQGYDWATQVEILRREGSAWIEESAGRREQALELMRSAAALEDSTEKHPVTPGAIIPAREFLGDLLLEQGKPADALAEYETSLASAPNRFHGIAGAERAARLAGNEARASEFRSRLVALASHGDTTRPELSGTPAAPPGSPAP
jgi:tetratricopeptide (TPR) repeat protein